MFGFFSISLKNVLHSVQIVVEVFDDYIQLIKIIKNPVNINAAAATLA